MNVGFIGLGHMGQPMALRLLKSGQRLVAVLRRPVEPAARNGHAATAGGISAGGE
jgi:3-hydroxyisobutyrate dehydrogenase-like beta-hydroxyacid dehydrogenase